MFIKQLHKESEKQAKNGKRYLQYVNNKEFIYVIHIYITANHFLEKQTKKTDNPKENGQNTWTGTSQEKKSTWSISYKKIFNIIYN